MPNPVHAVEAAGEKERGQLNEAERRAKEVFAPQDVRAFDRSGEEALEKAGLLFVEERRRCAADGKQQKHHGPSASLRVAAAFFTFWPDSCSDSILRIRSRNAGADEEAAAAVFSAELSCASLSETENNFPDIMSS